MPWSVPVRVSVGGAADGADTPESADKPALARLMDWAGRVGVTAVLMNGRAIAHASSGRRARFPALRELYSGALGRFLEIGSAAGGGGHRGRPDASHRRANPGGPFAGDDDAITRISVAAPGGNRFQRVNQAGVSATGMKSSPTRRWSAAFGGSATSADTRRERTA
jgi:hypothetical protein